MKRKRKQYALAALTHRAMALEDGEPVTDGALDESDKDVRVLLDPNKTPKTLH
jgi:hypothetical protein